MGKVTSGRKFLVINLKSVLLSDSTKEYPEHYFYIMFLHCNFGTFIVPHNRGEQRQWSHLPKPQDLVSITATLCYSQRPFVYNERFQNSFILNNRS